MTANNRDSGKTPPPPSQKPAGSLSRSLNSPAGSLQSQRQPRRRSQRKGSKSERAAARFLESRGWSILHRNKKICGVETDIIAQKKGALMLLEVKSLKDESHLEKILSPKQKKRLKRAAACLADSFQGKFYFLLAAARETRGGGHDIQLYPID